MARQARKNLISNFVHIMVQGINKEYIFKENYYKEKYLKILLQKIENYDIDIVSYCIMDNHIHLVVYYREVGELAVFMKRVNTTYAKWYNECNNRVGYVFRDRYKTEQILDYHHLYSCINYVHNNPVKAKIIEKPEFYKFSSYKNFLSDDKILNSKFFKFLNISLGDFKEIFIKSINSDFYSFRQQSPEKIIEDYLREKKLQNVEAIVSQKNFKELVNRLKENSNLKFAEIAKLLKVSRTTLYRIRKK